MILVRSPLRITLGGGGTDTPAYANVHGGFWMTAAIDRYVYVSVHRPFEPGIVLRYSQMERVSAVEDIQHPIIRESLKLMGVKPPLEISSLADIPAGTGLGSSGSFTTALLAALAAHQHDLISTRDLAEQAYQVEAVRLGRAAGRQDAYSAAYGGITAFRQNTFGHVDAQTLNLSEETRSRLEDGLLLFFTGFTHDAHTVLSDVRLTPEALTQNLHSVKGWGEETRRCLEAGDLSDFGALLTEQWEFKQRRSPNMTNPQIDEMHRLAMRNGALGGKLCGAGGGGFLLFYTETPARLREAMRGAGVQETRFRFDYEGTKVLVS